MEPRTTKIKGFDMLAGKDGYAKIYVNRTGAEKAALKMGEGWQVYHFTRPWYVGKIAVSGP
jgi:hypothetical protein